MYFVQMIIAFLVLLGIGLFWMSLLNVNVGESMLLSTVSVIVLLFFSSFTGTFSYGFYVICMVSLLGVSIYLIKEIKRIHVTASGQIKKKQVFTPAFLGVACIFFISLIILHNDFIQHIDELHHWAAAVKYMLTRDQMPTGADFLGGAGNYAFATSLFHLFFQKFTGYSEQAMYVSATLLMWIGFLLPFSGYKKEDWKKIAVYIGIVFIALFTLYSQGSKSLYVDLPVASWAGGLAGWWTNRSKEKRDYFVAGSGLVMLHFFKASAGLLMALFVIFFMVLYTFAVEQRRLDNAQMMKKIKRGLLLLYILVFSGSIGVIGIAASIKPYAPEIVSVQDTSAELVESTLTSDVQTQQWAIAGIKLPDQMSDMINIVKLSRTKIKKTMGAFLTKSFGDPLAPRSNWALPFVPCMFIILILLRFSCGLNGSWDRGFLYILYGGFVALAYSATLFFSYLFMFAYELSIELRSSRRYFSVCCIFLFVLVMTELLRNADKREGRIENVKSKEKMRHCVLIAMAFFFLLGLNEKFIPNVTALDKENTAGYKKLNATKKQIDKIDNIIKEDDKVYYICQYSGDELGGAELFNASALYYLEPRVSNYLAEPWKFKENGSNIRLEEYDISLESLPDLLTQGKYTYLWVWKSDKYLEQTLPKVMDCKDVEGRTLYKVEYLDGYAVGLELVKKL